MTQVVVLSGDGRLEEALRSAGLSVARLEPAAISQYAGTSNAPSAFVIDVRGQNALPAGLAAIRKQHPDTGIVLVASALEPHLMLEAMRAGVTEYVHEPVTPKALEDAVRRVIADVAPEPAGQVVAFVGAKGGVGTTTLAVNTATTLAAVAGPVLLIDLHLGQGDGALFLGAEPRFSIVDAIEHVHRVDESFFSGLVEKTKAGVDLLASSDRLPVGPVDPKRVRALLDFAIRKYRFVVLDVPRSDATMLDCLQIASSIVVVTSQELSALRNAGRLAHMLTERYGAPRVKAVVNRFDRKADLAQADVERAIGSPVKHLIPSDYHTAVDALHAGQPLVLEHTRLAQAFKSLAEDLGGTNKKRVEEQPAHGLGRLVFKRV